MDVGGMFNEVVNSTIKSKIDALNFDGIFKDKITPQLEKSVEAGIGNFFQSYHFQDRAANMFNRDIFKIYDEALTDCAVVKKIIDDAKDDKNSALTELITTIKTAEKNDEKINEAKAKFIKKMTEINKKLGGGSPGTQKIFNDLSNKMGSTPSTASAVSGGNLTEILTKIAEKSKSAINERESNINELRTNMPGGGKSKKRLGGGKSKKRRKRTYKRR
jgi:hypothetical protein